MKSKNTMLRPFSMIGRSALAFGVALSVLGCSAANDDESLDTRTQAVAQRCTVRGNPRVTTGCAQNEYCSVVACTNSIPPSCWGTCQVAKWVPAPKEEACSGSFACLCGTPACVDGEWTCIGHCGSPDPTE
jgi:hypothetical protein